MRPTKTKLIMLQLAGYGYHTLFPAGVNVRGIELDLVPEPTNSHDRNAVMMLYGTDKLGYVPGAYSEIVAALLNAGVKLTAELVNESVNRGDKCYVHLCLHSNKE